MGFGCLQNGAYRLGQAKKEVNETRESGSSVNTIKDVFPGHVQKEIVLYLFHRYVYLHPCLPETKHNSAPRSAPSTQRLQICLQETIFSPNNLPGKHKHDPVHLNCIGAECCVIKY